MTPFLTVLTILAAGASTQPYQGQPSEGERLSWLETFASCAAVWEVAAGLPAVTSSEDRRFFADRRRDAIAAARKLGREAPAALRRADEELKPELIQLAALEPRTFSAGPYRRCAEHAHTASRLAGAPNIVGAPGTIIH
jgi:hypothetical protein